jgi:hypothetical protein
MAEQETVCVVKGCDRPVRVHSLKLCTGHYRRYERSVKAWEDKHESPAPLAVRKTLQRNVYKSGPLRRRKKVPTTCIEPGCEAQAEKRDYCNKHYMVHRRAGDF